MNMVLLNKINSLFLLKYNLIILKWISRLTFHGVNTSNILYLFESSGNNHVVCSRLFRRCKSKYFSWRFDYRANHKKMGSGKNTGKSILDFNCHDFLSVLILLVIAKTFRTVYRVEDFWSQRKGHVKVLTKVNIKSKRKPLPPKSKVTILKERPSLTWEQK